MEIDVAIRDASHVSGSSRETGTIIGRVMAVVALLFGALLVIYELTGFDVRMLVRDPAETAMLPEYAGAYTYLGVLVLWSAGLIGILAGVMLRGRHADPRMWRLLVGVGVASCWLAADDLFMIHEWLGLVLSRFVGAENEYLGRTRLEGVVFASYGIVALGWMVRYRAVILRTEAIFLLLAMGCLGLSAGVDIGAYLFPGLVPAGQVWDAARTYAEEMFKFSGILFLLVYIGRTSLASNNVAFPKHRL